MMKTTGLAVMFMSQIALAGALEQNLGPAEAARMEVTSATGVFEGVRDAELTLFQVEAPSSIQGTRITLMLDGEAREYAVRSMSASRCGWTSYEAELIQGGDAIYVGAEMLQLTDHHASTRCLPSDRPLRARWTATLMHTAGDVIDPTYESNSVLKMRGNPVVVYSPR